MLATVSCEMRRACAMPRRSPLTSVTCALFIATSVPVPIATPTSALASAGASLMPSPAIATTPPSTAPEGASGYRAGSAANLLLQPALQK